MRICAIQAWFDSCRVCEYRKADTKTTSNRNEIYIISEHIYRISIKAYISKYYTRGSSSKKCDSHRAHDILIRNKP